MNINQLTEGLTQAFVNENHRIVFWYDPEGDFEHEINNIDLPEVTSINMRGQSALAIKIKLEVDDTTGKYLLYFPYAEPEQEADWLLDIKLYSRNFYADKISLIFNELGLQQQQVRQHLAAREQFLSSKERLKQLKKWIQPNSNETQLDLAMIAVVTKAESADIPHILFALASESVDNDLGLDGSPPSLTELNKFGLSHRLITAIQEETGYLASDEEQSGETPFNFGHFLIRLLTTGFCEGIGDIPPWAKPLAIATGNANATARTLLSRWRDSAQYYKAFDTVSNWVAAALGIPEKIDELALDQLAEIETFECIEKQIIKEIALHCQEADERDLEHFSQVIAKRLNKHWASRHKNDPSRKKYRLIYRALSSAIELFLLRLNHANGFHFESVHDLYSAYESDLYRFDMAYRHYCEASYRAHVDILKPLDEAVEQTYANWYLDHLAKSWGDKIDAESRLEHWHLPNINNQQQFYDTHVKRAFKKAKNSRVVVIISDAFRYEAAVELQQRINEKRYSKASLSSQLGVVPSYTTLGMASLLPHNSLEYRENISDDVFVDGKSSKGTAARNKLLASHKGMAVTAEEIKSWSRDQGREAIKDKQLIYVYHNVIDARGDSLSTESETFLAVEQAIEELTELTHKIINNLNCSTVLVTADHGFLYQQSKLDLSDRTSLEDKPSHALKTKKRYVIGFDLGTPKDAWQGTTQLTASTQSDTQFWIPKGANRFHFIGGARFVHGGIMPQEIVVPIVTVKGLRGEKAEKRTKRKVSVISPKPVIKMVNTIQRFDLMQTEAVSDLILPITLSVAIYDAETKISSEEMLTFDSKTDSVADRVKSVRLSLSGRQFDRKKTYFLILKDKDLNVETERYSVNIDLAFTDDFL